MGILIRNDGTVEPFGFRLLRESRLALAAPVDYVAEQIAGRDGELVLATALRDRELELRGVMETASPRESKSALAQQFLSLLSWQDLAFEGDPGRILRVRLTEKPEIAEGPSWLEVSLPLVAKPFWESATVKTVSLPSPVSDLVVEAGGTLSAPLTITVQGPATNPAITVNGKTISYQGSLSSVDRLEIFSEYQTAKFNNVNALASIAGGFPEFKPGSNTVSSTVGNTTISWKERWA